MVVKLIVKQTPGIITMLTLQGNTRIAFLFFFLSHIPITLLVDGQAFFRRSFYPQALQDVVDWYAVTFKVCILCLILSIAVIISLLSQSN